MFTCATDKGTCFSSGQDEGATYLGQAVGDPNSIPKMVDDYVQNWFSKGRYVLAKLDRPVQTLRRRLNLTEQDALKSAGGPSR